MAAPMQNVTFSALRFYRRLLNNGVPVITQKKTASSSSVNKDDQPLTSKNSGAQVAESADGKTVICWHPEPAFPYEHTQPLPGVEAELRHADSPMKVQYLREDMLRFKQYGPSNPELATMFQTTKHQWYPNSADKYRKPNPPKDREGV